MSDPVWTEVLEEARERAVAVLGLTLPSGRPTAWPVTPYVLRDQLVVTSTLAYPRKAEHLARRPAADILIGGHLVACDAQVYGDVDGHWFGRTLLQQELAKYPPARKIVATPGATRLFRWYFGRAVIVLHPRAIRPTPFSSSSVLVTLQDARPVLTPVQPPERIVAGDTMHVPDVADGPACVMTHRESSDLSVLRQQHAHGRVLGRRFVCDRVVGNLDLTPPSAVGQLRELRALARQGKAGADIVRQWAPAELLGATTVEPQHAGSSRVAAYDPPIQRTEL